MTVAIQHRLPPKGRISKGNYNYSGKALMSEVFRRFLLITIASSMLLIAAAFAGAQQGSLETGRSYSPTAADIMACIGKAAFIGMMASLWKYRGLRRANLVRGPSTWVMVLLGGAVGILGVIAFVSIQQAVQRLEPANNCVGVRGGQTYWTRC